jgi:CubicO group peptidase (beta-lactamase class C family)
MRKGSFFLALLAILITGVIQVTPAPAQDTPDYWPTDGWRTSTPEQQGMDSERLANMLTFVEEKEIDLHSIVIIRDGYIVTEVYFPGSDEQTKYHIYSCTKSVISALVGIAIDQGYLEGVDQPILDFFPDREIDHLDDVKQSMTIENFLTMSSGLDWPDPNFTLTGRMVSQSDWVGFVLDRPMAAEPGTTFVYNNGLPHVLSVILQQETGMSTAAFAQQVLFGPLGIRSDDYRWETDWHNTAIGGWGLWLKARDMAKFGYLYLHDGMWDGAQIIPTAWVAASTRGHIFTTSPLTYGYLWWIGPDYYAARGLEAQLIYVVPDQRMVVVFTAALRGTDEMIPDRLMEMYILPAAQSSEPLPANPDGNARLQAAVDAIQE